MLAEESLTFTQNELYSCAAPVIIRISVQTLTPDIATIAKRFNQKTNSTAV